MKITISREFDTVEDAIDFLHAVGGDVQLAVPPVNPPAVSTTQPDAPKPRKPRSDAGKARGPYKTNGQPAASEPGSAGNSVPAIPAAPAPTNPTAPTTAAAQPLEGQRAEFPAPAAVDPSKPLTEADTRTALKKVNDTLGTGGMQKCRDVLAFFEVERISLLPKEKYAEFIAYCEKIVARKAGGA